MNTEVPLEGNPPQLSGLIRELLSRRGAALESKRPSVRKIYDFEWDLSGGPFHMEGRRGQVSRRDYSYLPQVSRRALISKGSGQRRRGRHGNHIL